MKQMFEVKAENGTTVGRYENYPEAFAAMMRLGEGGSLLYGPEELPHCDVRRLPHKFAQSLVSLPCEVSGIVAFFQKTQAVLVGLGHYIKDYTVEVNRQTFNTDTQSTVTDVRIKGACDCCGEVLSVVIVRGDRPPRIVRGSRMIATECSKTTKVPLLVTKKRLAWHGVAS